VTLGRRRLVLASQSPARLATLRSAGLAPEVVVSGVDESGVGIDDPAGLSLELARRKARAVAPSVDGEALVVGCDSVLEFDGVAHGKPGSAAVAAARWREMRGRSGVLHTGHWVVDTGSGREVGREAATTVHFADLSDDEVDAYVASGEPLQVAGAFTIDGLGGWFVDGVGGDPHNVVGVSLPALRAMLRELGHGLRDIGYPACQ
jgi:septum formation protein